MRQTVVMNRWRHKIKAMTSALPTSFRDPIHWLFAGIYVTLLLITVWHHEMWRDELEVWLVVRDNSISSMFSHLHTVAHPPLWYVIVWLVQQFSSDPVAMQTAHVVIAIGTMTLLLFYSPFHRWHKFLLVANYYFLYEFGAISRNYSLCVFFAFVIVILFCRRQRPFWLLSASLLLLGLTNFLGMILVFGFCLYLLAESIQNHGSVDTNRLLRTSSVLAIAAVGVMAAAFSAYPFQGWQVVTMIKERLIRPDHFYFLLKALSKSYIPVPPLRTAFWNESLFSPRLLLLGAPFILFLASLLLRARPLILAFYLFITGMLALFFYFYFTGYLRHHGFFFLTWFLACWLYCGQQEEAARVTNLRWAKSALIALLSVQALAGLIALVLEVRHPFSAGQQAAQYIRENHLQKSVLVGDPDYAMQSVSAWLNQKLYYPIIDDEGSFVLWPDPRRKKTSPDQTHFKSAYRDYVQQSTQRLADSLRVQAVLITNYRLDRPLLISFTGTIEPNEKMYLYMFPPKP